jgi:hypothetical protein
VERIILLYLRQRGLKTFRTICRISSFKKSSIA